MARCACLDGYLQPKLGNCLRSERVAIWLLSLFVFCILNFVFLFLFCLACVLLSCIAVFFLSFVVFWYLKVRCSKS